MRSVRSLQAKLELYITDVEMILKRFTKKKKNDIEPIFY